ncbi:MAG: DUF1553 domain-containing protein [bacterium]
MKTYSILLTTFFVASTIQAVSQLKPVATSSNIFETAASAMPESKIDKLVEKQLSKLGVKPALCSDQVFVRRVYLDVIGTLPTAKEAREFIQDQDTHKRTALVNRLLERPEFADYWAMKWSDILRVKAEFPVNLWPNAAQAYHHWIKTSLRDNKPYDQFVREMLTANGSNFRVGPVNFYRAVQNKTPEGIAAAVALTFMGTRAESWAKKDYLPGMSVFFSQISYKPTREWKEEIVYWDTDKEFNDAIKAAELAAITAVQATNTVSKGSTHALSASVTNALPPKATTTVTPIVAVKPAVVSLPKIARFPDGTCLKRLPADKDPREVFADWLITPKNPWFSTIIVNRIWAWVMGRGIIHETDDIRPDNPPSNPKLLEYLQEVFVDSHYNMKHLLRLILTSQTYQYSSIIPASNAPEKVGTLFGYYPLRRLDAEVLIDAINKVTGTSDLYTSAIPEPFTFIPDNKPAIALPDGSITSTFLELFGRPARATGQDNERVNKPMPTQKMHLLNSGHIQRKLESSPIIKRILKDNTVKNKDKTPEILEELYLTILSRFPTADELKNVQAYIKTGVVRGNDMWIDVAWALINSEEFLYRH